MTFMGIYIIYENGVRSPRLHLYSFFKFEAEKVGGCFNFIFPSDLYYGGG
jgi:hypothetical protein